MAWSLAHAKLHTLLRKRILLPRNSHILMAVSGGQDSLCLARLLIDIQPQWQWSLALVHCDHRWREDSADNAAHVMRLAESWQIPAWVEVASTPLPSEADARQWRYGIFSKLARSQGYSYVVTGHTASDRAETALYNLIRGTGLDGISSLPWYRSLDKHQPMVSLVRPLLEFSRRDTGAFCQQQHIPVWEDSSNLDLRFRRNRIRQELLPYLRQHFNPQVEQSLSQLSEITAADTDYLQAQTHKLYVQVITEHLPDAPKSIEMDNPAASIWEIQIQRLEREPLALQRRVIRQLLQKALPKPPSFQQIDVLTALLRSPNGSRSDTFPGGFVAEVRKPVIWLGRFS